MQGPWEWAAAAGAWGGEAERGGRGRNTAADEAGWVDSGHQQKTSKHRPRNLATSEISQSGKDRDPVISLMCGI